MTLGHLRPTNEIPAPTGSWQPLGQDPSSSFNPQLFIGQFLERFGSDPETSLGRAVLKELRALAKENDPELFWEGALGLAGRLEREDRLDSAAALFQGIAQTAAPSFPELSSRAERNLKAMSGEGEVGARFEFLLRRFARETRDPWMLAGFGAGSLAFRAAKLGTLSQLWSPGQGFFLGRTGAGLIASAAGIGVEAPVFLFTSKLGRQLGGVAQDWRRETLAHELAGVGITLLCLKGVGVLSGKAVQALGSPPAPTSGLSRFANAAIPQAGMLTGIALARRFEESLGLRPHLDNATLITDTLSTYLQFFVSGRLAERALGPKFEALQTALNWQPPRLTEGASRNSLACSAATVLPNAKGPSAPRPASIQELMQAPLLMSGGFGDGDGRDSSPENLRYGYGADTVMGILFHPDAKPSNAVPMVTSAPTRIPPMLRHVYRYRPDRQHPRTILVEPVLGSLQEISPKVEITPEYLNSLTRAEGSNFPEKTPFRIMQVTERRTFTAKVLDRKLLWSQENDPIWARINRHSVSNEFDAETPLELYLYIESLTRQPKPSAQADYRVHYQGRDPAYYELPFDKFIERSLRFYKIAGRSFSVEIEGGPPKRFVNPDGEGDWTFEESAIHAEAPARSSGPPRPAFPSQLTPNPVKKFGAVPPFAVITSAQGLKDVANLLSDRSLPRRIEIWFESTSSNSLMDLEGWQRIFQDLRPGSILVVHDSHAKKSHTFQRREEQVWSRSSHWNKPLAWEPGLALSSRDVMDLLQQLQFIINTKSVSDPSLTVSILGDWEPYHGKLLTNLLNQWGNVPFEKIEIQAARPRSDVWLRLHRNHVGRFVSVD